MNLDIEKQLLNKGYNFIAGVDEAGRGPLAGPVVAACVIIDKDFEIKEDSELTKVTDSKKLSAKKREELFKIIKENVKAVEISVVSSEMIDKTNILKASLTAMLKAVEKCDIKADYVLVDGSFKIPKLKTDQEAIKGGDGIAFTIAAASIIAKVSRDFLMTEYDKKYPEYEFSRHKGYGTKIHMEKLKEIGPCPIHRRSFAPVRKALKNKKEY
ncbi:MAG: ribonuclease HII [Patescibacteria group bacterium]|jgi:ribonuclease HII|nr:ribonuclease HII [Patescibacteria group bacterium]